MGTKGTTFWEDTLQADYCNCIISSLVSIAQVSIGCYSRVHSIALQSVEEEGGTREENEKFLKPGTFDIASGNIVCGNIVSGTTKEQQMASCEGRLGMLWQ